ncbi:tripartite tricarboxylate transporter TctB family protein [Acidisphaera sp. L21]|uniref:tripartite tricarboxylate transporter TctB family protein n=1 Tax=Acidisphaera sp. L21 TaxID=1641851 RepID=UPI001C2041AF|nr:tripartite tricarboxylate transporter TctB family protein [Acidisphaera sp. L21]
MPLLPPQAPEPAAGIFLTAKELSCVVMYARASLSRSNVAKRNVSKNAPPNPKAAYEPGTIRCGAWRRRGALDMPRQSTAQGLLLAAIGLFFGLNALRYPVGTLARFGPGLFPLVVSAALLVLAVAMLVRSRFITSPPLHFNIRNIAIIMAALAGFVVVTTFVDMAAGIVVLVFTATLAGTAYHWRRNALVAAGLIVIALAFEQLLGLRLGVV